MHEHHTSVNKKKAGKSLNQAMGILNKVAIMIEEDKYCPDIIQQVDAVVGLLTRVKKELLVGHLNHCLESRLTTDRAKTIDELFKIYNLSK